MRRFIDKIAAKLGYTSNKIEDIETLDPQEIDIAVEVIRRTNDIYWLARMRNVAAGIGDKDAVMLANGIDEIMRYQSWLIAQSAAKKAGETT